MSKEITQQNETPMTLEQYLELDRKRAARRILNETKIFGQITKKYVGQAKPRMKDNMPVHDEDGNPMFYTPPMSITFGYTGGSLELPINDENLFNSVEEFGEYLLIARHGKVKVFGKEQDGLIPLRFES
ncbi:MAG: hypothetical protein M0P91_09735 [Sulfuricurvum sp.]|jgi:hypothetical protein|uniref:hypothetical protein n=1 Tax=Sulfuricurvum sp. TaxID=2025608 RepID=UPI0025EF5359|nr:hypothetical protein [Sulfuricurvum sp.]MCK9373469.1 hypothetical protein [Sulfuricurvum sp.]